MTKIATSVIGTLSTGHTFDAIAQINTLPDAINKAGSLRMLSQRITKAWLQIIGRITPDISQKILDDSISLFDKRLSELQSYTRQDLAVKIQYDAIEKEWNEFKKMIRGKVPSTDMIDTVLLKSDQIRNFANNAVNELERGSTVPANELVNLAGRQRMLSQRIALEIIRARLPGQPKEISKTLIDSINLYKLSHQKLLAHPSYGGAIKAQLDSAALMWNFFESAPSNKSPEVGTQVASASEILLKTLDILVSMYEKI